MKKKKILVLGTGTAGLITASMIKSLWKDYVDVSVYYDAKSPNIGVGESTTPAIIRFLNCVDIEIKDLIKNIGATLKLGINFKNWTSNSEYFHGFLQGNLQFGSDRFVNFPYSAYSITNDEYAGGYLFNLPTTTIPAYDLNSFAHGIHVDAKKLANFIQEKFKDRVNFIDDIATSVNLNDGKIDSIDFEKSGNVKADLYFDCSGFSSYIFKNLNPKWNDITDILPIDRAIPQQVPYEMEEVPSYTLAEATDNGWIWKIPVGNRFGTGYLYSSKFTSDDEARSKYDSWLKQEFNISLETDRIIKYRPGYYENNWIENCISIGLSSGFVEPLESTGIHIIIAQILNLSKFSPTLGNLPFERRKANLSNKTLYEDIVNFICLHYCTNRQDSNYWKYMTLNKTDWMIDFETQCKYGFFTDDMNNSSLWTIDSYIQVAIGLNLLNRDSVVKYIDTPLLHNSIVEKMKSVHHQQKNHKEKFRKYGVSHREALDLIINGK